MFLERRSFCWVYAGTLTGLCHCSVRTEFFVRAGKTSIQQVLFNDLPPKQTFYLETTMRIVKHAFECVRLTPYMSAGFELATRISTVIPLEIWDCPGNVTVETLGAPLSQFSTMIFVIDIRVRSIHRSRLLQRLTHILMKDLYNQPISKLAEFIVAAYQENPDMNLEVFVHKAEKLQEDDKIGLLRPLPLHLTTFSHYIQRTFGRSTNASLTGCWISHQSMSKYN